MMKTITTWNNLVILFLILSKDVPTVFGIGGNDETTEEELSYSDINEPSTNSAKENAQLMKSLAEEYTSPFEMKVTGVQPVEQEMIQRYKVDIEKRDECTRAIHNEGFIYLTALKNYMLRFLGMTEFEMLNYAMSDDPVCIHKKSEQFIFKEYEEDKKGISVLKIKRETVPVQVKNGKPNFAYNYILDIENKLKYTTRLAYVAETFCMIEVCKTKLFLENENETKNSTPISSTPEQQSTSSQNMSKQNAQTKLSKNKLKELLLLQVDDPEDSKRFVMPLTKDNITLKEVKEDKYITDNAKILSLIKIRNDSPFYDTFFDRVIEKTGMVDKREIKCILYACVTELKTMKFHYLIPEDNIKNSIDPSLLSDPLVPSIYRDFQRRYWNHLQPHTDSKSWRLLNVNTWCIAQTCLDELARFGGVHVTFDENRLHLASLLREPIQESHGSFVNDFKTQLNNSQISGNRTIFAHCAAESCKAELSINGFLTSFSGINSKQYLNDHFTEIAPLMNLFGMVRLYVLHLQNYLDKSFKYHTTTYRNIVHWDPSAFCENYTANGM